MWLYETVILLCAGSSLTLAAIIWSKRPVQGAASLAALFLVMGWSSLCYSMDLGSTNLDFSVFWNRAGLLSDVFVTPLMLILALTITGEKKPRPRSIALFVLLTFCVPMLSWTNDWHHLYFTKVWIDSSGPMPVLAKARGPFFPILFAYMYLCIFIAMGVVIRALFRVRPKERPQLFLLLIAFLLPLLSDLPYVFHWLPPNCPHINLVLLGYFASSLLLAVALFRFQLLSPIPLDASERNDLLLRHGNTFLFTIDPDGIITYISPNCTDLTGYTQAETIGKHFTAHTAAEDHSACRAFFQKVEGSRLPQSGLEHRIIHKEGAVRWYATSLRPAYDPKGKFISYVGTAHDITQLTEAKRSLRDKNMELADLIESREEELRAAMRDALTAAEGEARRIGENIHDDLCHDLICLARRTESAKQAADSANALDEIQQQAEILTHTARLYSHDLALYELDVQSLPDAISSLAQRAEQFFDVNVEINSSENFPVLSPANANHVFRIVRELIANANRHANARNIWIDMLPGNGQLVISVSNDGQPLPDSVTPGLGTRQIRMRTRLLDGTFFLSRRPDGKTVAELTVPPP